MASQESLPEEEKEEVALELSKVPAAEVESVAPVLVYSKWEEVGRKAAGQKQHGELDSKKLQPGDSLRS